MSAAGLRRNRDFGILCVGQGLSMLGTGASSIALPVLVLRMTHSPLRVGLVEAAWTGALAVACLPGGVVADWFDRRKVLLACELGRAAASAALTGAILVGYCPLPVLLAAGVVLGLLTAPFNAAGPATLRQIVPESQLPAALAVIKVRGQAALLLGPVLGGWLFMLSSSAPFWLDAASYATSAASVLALRTQLRAPGGRHESGWWSPFVAGLRYLWQDRFMRNMTLIASGQNFIFEGVYLAIVMVSAQRGASGLSVGLITATSSAGALAGAFLIPYVNRRFSLDEVLLAGGVVCAALVTAMGISDNPAVLAALLAAGSLATALSSTVMMIARMNRTPDHLQSRTNSAIGLLFMASPPLGSALAGLLKDTLPDSHIFLLFGGLSALLATTMHRTRALSSDTEEQGPDLNL
jgi:MFS family permease